jgi:hypothetical protein
MNAKRTVTKAYFSKRLAELCLKSGLSDFPKDEIDQHILLKSAVLMIGPAENLTEKEINARLEAWIDEVSHIKYIDRAALRRRLVDTGYLRRSTDGSLYQVPQPGPRPGLFEADIDQLDIPQVIADAREETARRKREYLEKARSQGKSK